MALQRQQSQLLAPEQGRRTGLDLPGLPWHRPRSPPAEVCRPWRITALRVLIFASNAFAVLLDGMEWRSASVRKHPDLKHP